MNEFDTPKDFQDPLVPDSMSIEEFQSRFPNAKKQSIDSLPDLSQSDFQSGLKPLSPVRRVIKRPEEGDVEIDIPQPKQFDKGERIEAPVPKRQTIDFDEIGNKVDDLKKAFSNLPKNFIDFDELSKQLQGLSDPNVPLGGSETSPLGVTGKTDFAKFISNLGLDRSKDEKGKFNVDYNKSASALFRIQFNRLDTDEERINFIEKKFGKGSVSRDPAGRWIIKDKDGTRFPVEDPDFTPKDIADAMAHAPEIAGFIAGTILTRGRNLPTQIISEALLASGGEVIAELGEEAAGLNVETFDEVKARAEGNFPLNVGVSVISRFPGVLIGVVKNPQAGGVTRETTKLAKDIDSLNLGRISAGKNPIKVSPSALNESPTIARFEGIFAKFPGSAGVFQKDRKALNQAIDDEVAFILKDAPNKSEVAPTIKKRIVKLLEERASELRAFHDARFTGIDPKTGSEVTVDGAEVALESFIKQTEAAKNSLVSIVGDQKFISTEGIKTNAKILKSRLVREAPKGKEKGKVIESLNPGAKESDLQSILQLPEFISLQEAQNIRGSLGEIISGRDVIGNVTEGQAKFLFKGIAEATDERNVGNFIKQLKVAPEDAKQFAKEYKAFNKNYKDGISTFNTKGAPLQKILTKFKNDPDKLVNSFFRRGNATNIAAIKSRIPADKFKVFQESSQDILLTGKTGKQLERAINTIGDDVLFTTFGEEKTGGFKAYAAAARDLQETPLKSFVSEMKAATDLMTKMVTPGNPLTALQARELLGASSKDWKNIQTAMAADLIKKSTKDGVLDGKLLLQNIADTEPETLKEIFKGTPLFENLRSIGNISRASKISEGSSVGGIASGAFILNTFRGLSSATVIIPTGAWMVAKTLTSNIAKAWLTNQPLSQMSRQTLRSATQSLIFANRTGDTRSPEETNKLIEDRAKQRRLSNDLVNIPR